MPSERARRLIEELHEIHSLEKRWEIAERYLQAAAKDGGVEVLAANFTWPIPKPDGSAQ